MKRELPEWKQGFLDTIPIGLSFILFGGIFGMMALQTGLDSWEAVMMSIIVFAGSAQFTALSMLSEQAGFWAIVLATFLINSRHLLMGLSMSPHYMKFSRSFINIISFGLIDEQYAITLNRFRNHAPSKAYIVTVTLTLYTTWIIGTWLGTVAGKWIPDPDSLGLGFSFTAMFLALVYYQLTSVIRILTFFLCGSIAVGLVFVLPNGLHLLVAGIVAFGIGYALPVRRVARQEAREA